VKITKGWTGNQREGGGFISKGYKRIELTGGFVKNNEAILAIIYG
jgi:hypothetical protein